MNSEELKAVRKRATEKLNKIRSTSITSPVIRPVKLSAKDPLIRGLVDNVYKLKERRKS